MRHVCGGAAGAAGGICTLRRTLSDRGSVGKDDRWFCTSGEILVREMELLGRELLGRLAHKSVEEFVIKNERIKNHIAVPATMDKNTPVPKSAK